VLFSEPKIPQSASKDYAFVLKKAFQCSSAIRKFLNRGRSGAGRSSVLVSVLFSEPKIPQIVPDRTRRVRVRVSVLFSEPKIPQTLPRTSRARSSSSVSVLFSEPKIPQISAEIAFHREDRRRFSALQRAENSSNERRRLLRTSESHVSVLFSEPKIPQIYVDDNSTVRLSMFQCSSASRKFLKPRQRRRG